MADLTGDKLIAELIALEGRTADDADSCPFETGQIVTPRRYTDGLWSMRGQPFIVLNTTLYEGTMSDIVSRDVSGGILPNMRVAHKSQYGDVIVRAWVEASDFEEWEKGKDYGAEEAQEAENKLWKSPEHPSQRAKVGDHIKVEGDPDVPNGIHEVTEVDEHDDWLRVSAGDHGWVPSESVKAII